MILKELIGNQWQIAPFLKAGAELWILDARFECCDDYEYNIEISSERFLSYIRIAIVSMMSGNHCLDEIRIKIGT